MKPLKVIQLHVRETPLGFAMVVDGFLHQLVEGARYQIRTEIDDIPLKPGFIEIHALTPYELVARIDFELIPNSDCLSVELKSYTVEINTVLDDLLSKLRATRHKFKIVGS